MMIRPRWLAKLLADLGGYFWLPCRICGEPFAGFEFGETEMFSFNQGRVVCSKPSCCEEARRRTKERLGCEFVESKLFDRIEVIEVEAKP